MKKEIYICDICGKEAEEPKDGRRNLQVIFTTEQNEGRRSEPYLDFLPIDLCLTDWSRVLNGEAIYVEGAMGFNKLHFK